MISHLYIENFKAIRKADLLIKPLTIFVGENSSGKSSILQLLALLNQTRSGYSQFPSGDRSNLYLGEIRDLMTKGEEKMRFGFTLARESLPKQIGAKYSVSWGYSVEREKRFGRIVELSIQIGNTSLKTLLKTIGNRTSEEHYFNEELVQGRDIPIIRNLSLLDFRIENVEARGLIPVGEEILKEEIRNFIESIIYLPPFRGIRGFGYDLDTRKPESLGSDEKEGFERTVVNLLNKITSTDPYRLDRLNEALKKYFEVSIRPADPETMFSPDEDRPLTTIQVRDELKGIYSNIVNTGFGTNQIITIGLGMIYQSSPNLILIEEPEIHLHPKSQAKAFDFINELRGDNVLLITTHSDHFLAKMQQRIKQKKLDVNDVALYYVERTDTDAQISKRAIDKEGRIEGGMPGFFDHSLNELQEFIDITKITSKTAKKNSNQSETSVIQE